MSRLPLTSTRAIYLIEATKLKQTLKGPLAQHGCCLTYWLILYTLSNEDMQVTALARWLSVSVPQITNSVRPLKRLGLVKSQTRTFDSRARLLSITQAGAELLEAIEETLAEPQKGSEFRHNTRGSAAATLVRNDKEHV